jgi:hypothetical protein
MIALMFGVWHLAAALDERRRKIIYGNIDKIAERTWFKLFLWMLNKL